MSIQARPLGRKGFTLVELLIVVAIIGVLSTIGVPTFRRMIQKSKKSEAKVNLGGIYTAEQAFVAEYGTFGNNLGRMGYETDGKPDQMTYTLGFFTNGCVPGAFRTAGTVTPASTAGAGAALAAAYPNYYVNQEATSPFFLIQSAYGPHSAAVKNVQTDLTASVLQMTSCFTAGGTDFVGPGLTNGRTYGTTTNEAGSATATDLNRFVAMAAGVIAPGVPKSAPPSTDTDVWAIDDTREMLNRRDGIR